MSFWVIIFNLNPLNRHYLYPPLFPNTRAKEGKNDPLIGAPGLFQGLWHASNPKIWWHGPTWHYEWVKFFATTPLKSCSGRLAYIVSSKFKNFLDLLCSLYVLPTLFFLRSHRYNRTQAIFWGISIPLGTFDHYDFLKGYSLESYPPKS